MTSTSNTKILVLLVWFLLTSKVYNTSSGLGDGLHNAETENLKAEKETKTAVISHDLNWPRLLAEDPGKIGGILEGSTLEGLHTYAELEYDLRPMHTLSFTICSTIFTTTDNFNPMFFSLLGQDGNQWFQAQMLQLSSDSGKRFYYSELNHFCNIDTMPVFPNQWVRSCITINTGSGLIQMVARGVLVDNSTFPEIADTKHLSGKIVLGGHFNPYVAKWMQVSNKVTNFNIFSSALSVENMVEYTKGGHCGEKGDFFAWDNMSWTLHGHAAIEHVVAELPCKEESLNLYSAQFPNMDTCMHFCENLGSKVPSVSSLQQWENMHSHLQGKLTRGGIWLPIDDKENEGEWKDFYSHQVVNYSLPWFKNEPNGGKSENCAMLDFSHSLRWTDIGCGEHPM